MQQLFIKNNILYLSLLLFIVIFAILNYIKPIFLYNKNGSIREFGVGYTNKTIMPVWLLSIILGILCYTGITFYINNIK
jgi:hypothetical protein